MDIKDIKKKKNRSIDRGRNVDNQDQEAKYLTIVTYHVDEIDSNFGSGIRIIAKEIFHNLVLKKNQPKVKNRF